MEKRLKGPQKGQEQISTSDYLKTIHRILIKRLPLLISLIIGCSAIALITSFIMKPVYEASTSLRIQKQSTFLQDTATASSGTKSLKAEAMWIKSRPILEEVMDTLAIGAEARTQKEYLKIQERLKENIEVEIVEDSPVLKITARWYSPDMAKDIANTLADVFIEKYTSFTQGKAKETTLFIKEQLELIELNLKRAQDKVSRFQKEEGTLSLTQKIQSLNSQLTQLETKKAQVDMELELAKMEREELKNQLNLKDEDLSKLTSKYSGISTTNILNNDLIQSLRARIAQLESEIVSLSTLYTDEYPPLIQRKEELNNAKEKLNKVLSNLVGGIDIADKDPLYQDPVLELVNTQIQIDTLKRQDESLGLLIADIKEQINFLPEKQVEYTNMVRQANVNEELYNLLLAKLQEAKIRERANEWDIRVFDRAYRPIEPVKPKPVANTVFGAILGLLLGIGISMMIEYFDDSFRTISDVESYLNLPVLAAIPKFKHRGKKKKQKQK